MLSEPELTVPSRRGFLTSLGLPILAGLFSFNPIAAMAAVPERSVTFHNRELGEKVRTVYFAQGRYQRQGLKEIRHLFRDKHDGSEIAIDPALVDLLWMVQRRLAPGQSIEVVCGYRSSRTNAMLRRRSRGVAANSYHIKGQAADIRIPKVAISHVHRYAVNLGAGGVGYYPRSNFVHVDTGPVRRWSGGRST